MSEALTAEKLVDMMASLPKVPAAPILVSYSLLPSEGAIRFTADTGKEYIGAGPTFWKQIPPGHGRHFDPYGIIVHDLDNDENHALRREFGDALMHVIKKIEPLPAWKP